MALRRLKLVREALSNIIFKIRKVTLTKLKRNYGPEQCDKNLISRILQNSHESIIK